MTEIQAQTIPHLLEGRDLVGAAKTGNRRVDKGSSDKRIKRRGGRVGIQKTHQNKPIQVFFFKLKKTGF